MQVPCDRVLAFAAGLASGCVVVEGAREAAMLTGPSTATDRMAISAPRTTLTTWFAIAHWAHAMLSTCAPVCWCGRGKARRTIFRFDTAVCQLQSVRIDTADHPTVWDDPRAPRPGRSTFVETSCSPLVSLSLWDVSVRCGGCETWCERQRETTEDGPIFSNAPKFIILGVLYRDDPRRSASLSETPHRVTDAPSDYGLKVPTATPGGRD